MDIAINKNSVFEAVRMNVSIVGRSYKDAEGNSLWDKIRIQERDKDLMEQHWNSAYASVLSAIENFLVGSSEDKLTIDDNRRINKYTAGDVSEVVSSILVNRMTSEWMKIKAVEYAAGFSDAAESSMENLLRKLRIKTEPELKKFNG